MVNIKGQHSVGLIIVFIALLFVATIAAGVLLSTGFSLQSDTLRTGKETTRESTSGFFIMDVVAEDGRDGAVNVFKQLVKLHPGADAINLDYIMLYINTENVTANLNYRGVSGTTELSNQGYNTWLTQEFDEGGQYHEVIDAVIDDVTPTNLDLDMDYDGSIDQIVVCNNARPHCANGYGRSYVGILLSSGPKVYVPLYNQTGGLVNLQIKNGEIFTNFLTPIENYGYLTAIGIENGAGGYQIPANRLHLYQPYFELNEDLDNDGQDDIFIINQTDLSVFYSSKGNTTEQFNLTTGVVYPLGIDLSTGGQILDEVEVELVDNESSTVFGILLLNGTTSRASYIDSSVTFNIIPENIYKGYFSIEYVQQGPNNIPGILSNGDVIRIYYETPRDIVEDEHVRITLIPRSGGQTFSEFYMPNIIYEQVVHLYP